MKKQILSSAHIVAALDRPFKQIQGADLKRIIGIGWVKGGKFDKFELVLDDISIHQVQTE